MGFIRSFVGPLVGSVKSSFGDQWLEYLKPDYENMPNASTVAVFPAVKVEGGQNSHGNSNIITNGSKILVPEGTVAVTMLDGQVTGFIAEPGGYTYTSTDPNAVSVFAGDGFFKGLGQTLGASIEKFKYGNVAAAQHNIFYVNCKPIQNFKFGTPGTIYWDDSFLMTQVGAKVRGTAVLRISNPATFLSYIPNDYLMGGKIFDFDDLDNKTADQFCQNIQSALTPALSKFSNDPVMGGRITAIQSNQDKFAQCLMAAIEEQFQWGEKVGLTIESVSLAPLEYDDASQEILEQAKKDDVALRSEMRRGQAYANNMPGMMAQASASAMNTAAGNENGAMMGFMGMGMAQQQGDRKSTRLNSSH